MTPDQQSLAFMAAARGGKHTLAEIAVLAGLTMDQAREVLVRGRRAGRIEIHDEDRQQIWIEVLPDPRRADSPKP